MAQDKSMLRSNQGVRCRVLDVRKRTGNYPWVCETARALPGPPSGTVLEQSEIRLGILTFVRNADQPSLRPSPAGGWHNSVHAQIHDHLTVVIVGVSHSKFGQMQAG